MGNLLGSGMGSSVQFSRSVLLLFATRWTAACQASLSITNSRGLLKLMSTELVMSSNHLIFCHPLLLLPSIFPSTRVISNESVLRIRWPKYWSFSSNISPSSEYSGLIAFRMDWLDLLAVPRHSQESSPTPQFKSINSSVLSFLYRPTFTYILDYWKNIKLIDNGNLVCDSELKLGLCNNPEGWEVERRFKREVQAVHLWLIHVDVWQKSNQYCKAITLQLKINLIKRA